MGLFLMVDGPVILQGQSLSNSVDCRAGALCRVILPSGWTPATMTFQLSTDGVLFNDVFDLTGREIQMNVTAGVSVLVPEPWSRAVAYIKFRSGLRAKPVLQAARRDFSLSLQKN